MGNCIKGSQEPDVLHCALVLKEAFLNSQQELRDKEAEIVILKSMNHTQVRMLGMKLKEKDEELAKYKLLNTELAKKNVHLMAYHVC